MSKEVFSVYHCKSCNKIEVTQYISREQMEEFGFTEEELKYIRLAGSLIKFCEALNITTVNEIVDFSLQDEDTYFVLKAKWSFDPVAEEYRANRQKKNLEHVLNKKVMIDFKKA